MSATWSDPDSTELKLADGSDVQVVVFDSVPSTLSVGHAPIDWASVPFDLCVEARTDTFP